MKTYLYIFSLLAPIFLPTSAAFAHSSLSDHVSHFNALNYFLGGSTNLVGLGAVIAVALFHVNLNKKRV